MARNRRKSEKNPAKSTWSATKEQAAFDVAADELTFAEIAAKNGIVESTLYLWKKEPEFIARTEQIQSEIWAEIRKHGIAVRENRVRALDRRWRKMRSVIEARGADPTMQDVPGGSTGLMVRTIKRVTVEDDDEGTKTSRDVEEFAVDTGVLRELREHEKQAAQELGQWAERHELTGADGGAIAVSVFDSALKKIYGDRAGEPPGA